MATVNDFRGQTARHKLVLVFDPSLDPATLQARLEAPH